MRFLLTICIGLLFLTSCQSDERYGSNQKAINDAPIEEAAAPPTEAVALPSLEGGLIEFVLEMANQRRHNIEWPGTERLHELTAGRMPMPEDFEMNRFWSAGLRLPDMVSREDAIADAVDFFELLALLYGSYIYFGGDDVFLPTLDSIIAELELKDEYLTNNRFAVILRSHLREIVQDNHFVVGGTQIGIRYDFFVMPDMEIFERSENGFYNRKTGEYVRHVNVRDRLIDPDEVFRRSLSETGEIYYSLVIEIPRGHVSETIAIIYDSYETEVDLRRFIPSQHSLVNTLLRHIDGIPIITIRTMGFPDSTQGRGYQSARQFLSVAKELRDEPLIIVDVRANGGGNGLLGPMWLHALTGTRIPDRNLRLRIGSYESEMENMKNLTEGMFYISFENFLFYNSPTALDENHIIFGDLSQDIVQSDRIIILLVDRYSASAAEHLANMLLSIENTLIVGQNTFGGMSTDMTFPSLNLPRTGQTVGFGASRFIHPDNHLPEGIGLAPDLWVNGDALTAVLALLGQETN